jgi:signal transduction histidine kinase
MKVNKVTLREELNEVPKVQGYPGEINQVFTNIIDNALDAMAEKGGTLTLGTDENENFVRVHISDTGTGIPPELLQKIFDPFFTTKDIGQGTGMGLDLVMKIMKSHHRGEVQVESEPGKTTFTLCFPKKI